MHFSSPAVLKPFGGVFENGVAFALDGFPRASGFHGVFENAVSGARGAPWRVSTFDGVFENRRFPAVPGGAAKPAP